jgi:hypothetical protein
MRAKDFITEAGLQKGQLLKHGGKYLEILIDKISAGEPLKVVPSKEKDYGKKVTIDPSEARNLKNQFYPKGNPELKDLDNGGNLVPVNDSARVNLKTIDGKVIPVGALLKTTDMVSLKEYGRGDLGEIAIAMGIYAKFIKHGQPITVQDILSIMKTLKFSKQEKGESILASTSSTIKWKIGKLDKISVLSKLPGRTMNYVEKKISAIGKMEDPNVSVLFESAVMWANSSKQLADGIKFVSENSATNVITVSCDGISNNKGTKVDVQTDIDGEPLAVISAKVDRAQMYQAKGHDFQKQIDVFSTIFGIDVAPYEKSWGNTVEEHLACLQKIWKKVKPIIAASVASNDTNKEFSLVKRLANGIIKYSNTAKPGDVDIVRLLGTPGKPGYKLLRVDNKLYKAMELVDLKVKELPVGVTIYGTYKGKSAELLRVRSVTAGPSIRTAVDTGPLLDDLAQIID